MGRAIILLVRRARARAREREREREKESDEGGGETVKKEKKRPTISIHTEESINSQFKPNPTIPGHSNDRRSPVILDEKLASKNGRRNIILVLFPFVVQIK